MNDDEFGNVVYYHQLLTGERLESLRPRFDRFEYDLVLDIGCGAGKALMRMHYAFGVLRAEGIEIEDAGKILRDAIERRKESNSKRGQDPPRSLPASIEDVFGFVNHQANDLLPRIETVIEVNQYIKNIRFGTSAVDYQPNRDYYDAVICSQVLHLMRSEESCRQVLEMIKNHVHQKSLVFISVKDGIPTNRGYIEAETLLTLCAHYRTLLGLKHYLGKHTTQGRAHIYTNL